MGKKSAGILLYRYVHGKCEVLLVHPGGPLHAKKDIGAWSIPKGEFTDEEDPLAAAKREFLEELGQAPPGTNYTALQPIRQKSGKLVYAWLAEGDIDTTRVVSNTFDFQWPPKSGRYITIPEVDKAEWFGPEVAKEKINPAQVALIEEMEKILSLT
ncbi:MAG: NUDIX domain-containing protein [Sphingobacteriales bacterium]|nr:MAG: NUDIX domain-containing protein [Sphingobacteriales bacterium]